MTVSKAIVDILINRGIKKVFGVPGVNVMPLFEEIERRENIDIIVCKTELGAAYMADAYARINGIGCCIATTGPGITNTYTGVCGCYYDSVPVLFISAEVRKDEIGKYGIQEMSGAGRTPNVIEAMKNVTKKAYAVNEPNVVQETMDIIIDDMLKGRKGPGYIEFGEDILNKPVENQQYVRKEYEYANKSFDFSEFGSYLENSEQFLVILGNGVRNVEYSMVHRFMKMLNAKCVTTALAKGIVSENEEYNLGVMGCYGNVEANEAIEQADTILVLGASLGYLSTCGWSIGIQDKKIIRVDIDGEEINRNCNPVLKYHCNISDWIEAVIPFLESQKNYLFKKFDFKKKYYDEEVLCSGDGKIDPVDVIKVINKYKSSNDIVIADVGQNAYWAERYIKMDKDSHFMIHGGMGAMGYGVAGAIGARLAQKDKNKGKVICVCGDGGFLMTGMELHTAYTYDVDVVWILLNNCGLGTQNAWAKRNDYMVSFDVKEADYVMLSNSLGICACRVDTVHMLENELKRALTDTKSHLFEVLSAKEKYPISYYGENVDNINR